MERRTVDRVVELDAEAGNTEVEHRLAAGVLAGLDLVESLVDLSQSIEGKNYLPDHVAGYAVVNKCHRSTLRRPARWASAGACPTIRSSGRRKRWSPGP